MPSRGEDRRRVIGRDGAFDDGAFEFAARARVRQIEALRIAPPGEKVLRQRDGGVRRAAEHGRLGDRVGDQVFDAHRVVHEPMHEGRVGAVLQKPPHQIGEQRLVRADRRIDAAGAVEALGSDHEPVEAFPHAMQALEFVVAPAERAPRHAIDRGERLRIVRGELRENGVAAREQALGAGEVAHIGVAFARENRIAGKAVHLRALDLAVPVRALYEPDHETALRPLRKADEEVDDERRALLIRLHHEAEPLPAAKRGFMRERLDEIERWLQPVRFLGVDVEADAALRRHKRQPQEPRIKLGADAIHLRKAVARMQRGQLHRNACAFVNARAAPCANRRDGVLVGTHVSGGVRLGDGRLAQHVVGIEKAALLEGPGVFERFLDGLAGHELAAEQPHREVHRLPDDRLAAARQRPRQSRRHAALAAGRDELAGDEQAPGRSVHEPGLACADVRAPIAARELVPNEEIAGGAVGNAQERLREAHQRDAFAARQRKLLHQRLDAEGIAALASQTLDQTVCEARRFARRLRIEPRFFDESRNAAGLGRAVSGADGCALPFRAILRAKLRRLNAAHGHSPS